MPILLRLLIGIPLAAIVAVLLFLVMRALIAMGEMNLEEDREAVRVEINPEVEEVTAMTREMTPDQVKQVDPPPPPPEITKAKSIQPTENMVNIGGEIPEFEQPDLGRNDISFDVSDRDAQPMVRVAHQYPMRAAERELEGNCRIRFDVSPEGEPFNVNAVSCTSSLFERDSIRTVQQWKYAPKIVDGVAVSRSGVETTLVYELDDR